MTESQTLLRQADELSRQMRPLLAQLDNLKEQLRWMQDEEHDLRKRQDEAYKEELASRRSNSCVPMERLKTANPAPSARWAIWRAYTSRITSHDGYCHRSYTPAGCVRWHLLFNLATFNSKMMAIENFAAWNPRNTNPYLP